MVINKPRIYSIVFSICYWMMAGFYLVIIRYFGLGDFAPPDLDLGAVMGYAAVVGFSIGLLFGLFPIHNLFQLNRRRSFLSVLLTGTFTYVAFFVVVIFMASSFGNSFQFAMSYVASPDGRIVLFHLSMSSAFYHFILQINKKFGPGVLLEYSMGKYFAPKQEERAFMFLDLKSSTRLAESLEHVSYSRLIQDCYAELTEPLNRFNGQVYQYVGDEVVISWKMSPSFSASLCVDFFYFFQQQLKSKEIYFRQNYNVLPEFKAGLHCGQVTVAEVGEIKTEIAYHGDVLNTASRIQSLCNQFEKSLLASESILHRLSERNRTVAEFVTEASLRGKEVSTRIFSIKKSY